MGWRMPSGRGSRLRLKVVGEAEAALVDAVEAALEECYAKVGFPEAGMVEVFVFAKDSDFRAFSLAEAARHGLRDLPDEGFPATHEAWSGIPRIRVSAERLRRMAPGLAKAAIHHEAAHSILHGSPEFYVLALPSSFMRACRDAGLDAGQAWRIAYMASLGVKDCHVTRLLCAHGFAEEQADFAYSLLEPSEEEVLARDLSKASRASRALFNASLLKPLGFAAPLAEVPGLRGEVERRAEAYLSTLSPVMLEDSGRLLGMFHRLTGDFHGDMQLAFREIGPLVGKWAAR